MSSETFRKMLETTESLFNKGIYDHAHFRLSGGEPFLAFENYKDIVTEYRNKFGNQMEFGVLTNFVKFDDEIADWMELNKLFEEVLREAKLKNSSEDALKEAKLFEEILNDCAVPALILNEDCGDVKEKETEDHVEMNNSAVHKELADKYLEPKLMESLWGYTHQGIVAKNNGMIITFKNPSISTPLICINRFAAANVTKTRVVRVNEFGLVRAAIRVCANIPARFLFSGWQGGSAFQAKFGFNAVSFRSAIYAFFH